MGINLAFGSISLSGIIDKKATVNSKNSKYSLKNFSSLNHKLSLNYLKMNLHYKNADLLPHTVTSDMRVIYTMQYEKGNTAYILPFASKSHKLIYKFKTPSVSN